MDIENSSLVLINIFFSIIKITFNFFKGIQFRNLFRNLTIFFHFLAYDWVFFVLLFLVLFEYQLLNSEKTENIKHKIRKTAIVRKDF